MIHLTITVDDADQLLADYGAGALVRVESSPNGLAPWSAVTTVALVAATDVYDTKDAAGTATTYYHTRYEDVPGTTVSAWSAPFLPVLPYATLGQVKGSWQTQPGFSMDARLIELRDEAATEIDAAIGWDFYAHPTATWIVEPKRYDDELCVHSGVTSLTLVRVSWDFGTTWTSLAAGDWVLVPRIPELGEPYDHVQMSPYSSVGSYWVPGWLVELTGQRGYAAVPTRIRNATVALARQLGGGDATMLGGGQIADDMAAGGGEVNGRWWPGVAWRAFQYYRGKFWCGV